MKLLIVYLNMISGFVIFNEFGGERQHLRLRSDVRGGGFGIFILSILNKLVGTINDFLKFTTKFLSKFVKLVH